MSKKNDPLYQKIKSELLDSILELPSEYKIPTRNELSTRFRVARATIDRAVSELVGEGYLYSKVGSGTFTVNRSEEGKNTSDDLSSCTWGFLLPSVTDYSFPELIRGVEDICSINNINLILCNTGEDPDKQNRYIDNLVAMHVSGIIVVPSSDDSVAAQSRLVELIKEGIKVVFCTAGNNSIRIPKVITNDFSGAALAVSHILDMGWKKPAFISKKYIQPTEHRFSGYVHTLDKMGIPLNLEHVCLECTEAPGCTLYDRIYRMLTLDNPPDSIFGSSDESALEVYNVAKDLGLEIGVDIGLVGYDNTFACEQVTPKLSSIKQPFYEIGKTVAKMLLEMINQDIFPEPRLVVLEPTLVARDSLGICFKQ